MIFQHLFGKVEAPTGPDERKKTIWQALANTPRAFRLVWACSPVGTIAMALLTVVGGLLPAAQAWTAKLIVDGVVAGLESGLSPAEGVAGVFPYIALEFGLLLLGTALTQGRSLVEHILHSRLNHQINSRSISTCVISRTPASTTSCRTRAARPTGGRSGSSTAASSWRRT
jgi:ATP-binding cassette subfamily B protein